MSKPGAALLVDLPAGFRVRHAIAAVPDRIAPSEGRSRLDAAARFPLGTAAFRRNGRVRSEHIYRDGRPPGRLPDSIPFLVRHSLILFHYEIAGIALEIGE